jgi:hypothetical protein
MWIPGDITGKVKPTVCAVIDGSEFRKLLDLLKEVIIKEFDRLFPEEKQEIVAYRSKINKFFRFVLEEFAEVLTQTLGVSVVFVYLKKRGLYYPVLSNGSGLSTLAEDFGIWKELEEELYKRLL